MKTVIVFSLSFIAILLASCKNTPVSEVEQKRKQLEARRQELKDKKEISAIEEELKNIEAEIEKTGNAVIPDASASATSSRGRILNTEVNLRSAASVKASKLGSLEKDEIVSILGKQDSPNGNEAVARKPLNLYAADNSLLGRLPQGKALVVETYGAETSVVSYEDRQKGKVTARAITANLDFTRGDSWYHVRRNNGQEGWVLGRFLLEI